MRISDPSTLLSVYSDEIIGLIETRRGSAGSNDGGVVAYRDPDSNTYTVHYYSIVGYDGRVVLSVGDYRLTREQAMERLLQRAQLQGRGMYEPSLG